MESAAEQGSRVGGTVSPRRRPRILWNIGAGAFSLFLILDGGASIRKRGEEVATVGPGAYFGELALLDGEPRSATVVATEDVTVAVLGVRMFRTLLREFPEMTLELLAGLAADVRRARDALDAAAMSARHEA